MTQDIDNVVAVAQREYSRANRELEQAQLAKDQAIVNIKKLRDEKKRWARILKADGRDPDAVEEPAIEALTGVVSPPPASLVPSEAALAAVAVDQEAVAFDSGLVSYFPDVDEPEPAGEVPEMPPTLRADDDPATAPVDDESNY